MLSCRFFSISHSIDEENASMIFIQTLLLLFFRSVFFFSLRFFLSVCLSVFLLVISNMKGVWVYVCVRALPVYIPIPSNSLDHLFVRLMPSIQYNNIWQTLPIASTFSSISVCCHSFYRFSFLFCMPSMSFGIVSVCVCMYFILALEFLY